MSVNTVAPVVVNPDMVSKKASVYVGTVPSIQKGSAPTPDAQIHARVTTAKASRGPMSRGTAFRPAMNSRAEIADPAPRAARKGLRSDAASWRDQSMGRI